MVDGVANSLDQEIYTPKGAMVDEHGVALDSDGDGRPDLIDFEIYTPQGRKTDAFGRSLKIRGEWPMHGPAPPNPLISSPDYDDHDDDGVPNIFDKEQATPLGAHVDQYGVAIDLDQDEVIDFYDLEKATPRGAGVNERGIALDGDEDGIIDLFDQELQTPKGLWVDRNGVRVDVDRDGVPFTLDRDSRTPFGAPVDKYGVALDSDKDGVIDLVDKEAFTPQGARVNKYGQNINPDRDGVPFAHDADANGDGKFDDDLIVVVFEDRVVLWRNHTRAEVETFVHLREKIEHVLMAPFGDRILTHSNHGYLRSWKSVKGQTEQIDMPADLSHITISPVGNEIFTALSDGSARIWFPSKAPRDPDGIIDYYRKQVARLSDEEIRILEND